ncbi:MAG: thiol:disulfide interchange protein DsbA/DsbL [Betaproteobacteria bacterium]|nr:thiol:disulfide interchange protein DsbA/DsbL [Betaproteobacteria bacterium]
MLKFRTLFAIAGLALAFTASSANAELQLGRDYELVNPPQPTEKNKIEVIEFFSYMCPHCDHIDPIVNQWQKTLAKDVVFHRVPVVFRPQWEAPARLYYTLEAMGELGKLHAAVFTAIHRENVDLSNESGVIDWAVKKGLDRKKFTDTFNSFAVVSKTQGSKQKQGAYGIAGVPSFVVAGKYRNPESVPGGYEGLMKRVDELIAKARAEQGRK